MSDQHVVSDSGEEPASPRMVEFCPTVLEDLLGRRIAAALIDLVVLAALFVILSAATGTITTSGARLAVTLGGSWLGVFLLLSLLYHLVLEAWTGQTLGKLLLDVRVLRAEGTRPSAGAVAVRTLLRVVDWLPLLYLAGFIAMLTTGTRRQRIGDLAARTVLARAHRPAGSRSLALLPLAGVVATAIALPVSQSGSAGGALAYNGHGVSFAYPTSWSVGTAHGVRSTGDLQWTAVVGPRTQHSAIVVQGFILKAPVTSSNIVAIVPELARLIQQNGDTLHGSPQMITIDHLPGAQFKVTSSGSPGQSILVFVFKGTTEYLVTCEYSPALATQIHRGCHQVLNTFTATG